MKKVANIILALMGVFLFSNSASFAAETKIDLYINDVNVKPDSTPYISDTNRTMVPISFVANGFNFNVKWNSGAREVVINNNGKEVKLYIDSKYALVDGVKTEIDPGKSTAVTIKGGRTMVPVSFVANTFDLEVGWVAYPRGGGIVKFYSKEYVKPYTPPVVPPVPSDVTTPTGKLNDSQVAFVKAQFSSNFDNNVAKWNLAQREGYVRDFMKDMKPPIGIQWLVAEQTVHKPGIPCISGLEIKTENGIKYQRVFNISVNYSNNDKLYNTADFEYRTNWEKVN